MEKRSLLFKLEQDIDRLLIEKMESHEITPERASLIAKFVLAHLPENLTDEQLMKVIPSLDDKFLELAVVVHKYMSDYENKYSKIVTHQVEDLIKHKHFEEASKMASDFFKSEST